MNSIPPSALSHYPTLRDDQRIAAKQQARDNLIAQWGGEPQFATYERRIVSKFGQNADRNGLIFLVGVFLAAFLISAVHIFTVGYQTFLESGSSDLVAVGVGGAFVFLAELAIIAFSYVTTVWDMPRAVKISMYAGIAGSAFIATIGNINAVILYKDAPFDWVVAWWRALATAPNEWALATLPPFLTVLVGMGIKYRLLNESRQRHDAQTLFDKAVSEWEFKVAHLEQHTEWKERYAHALWDTWRKGKRRDLLSAITPDLRNQIVWREMDADQFFSHADHTRSDTPPYDEHTPDHTADNTALDRVRVHLLQHPEDQELSFRKLADAAGVSIHTVQRYRESSNGQHTN
jgi:hypothetical protein